MTKRRAVDHAIEEGMEPPPPAKKRSNAGKKRVAFTAPNASTKAIIKRNATTSPLLRLPPEIRDRIWREVLGDRLIHVDYRLYDDYDMDFEDFEDFYQSIFDRTPWRSLVCENDGPEDRPNRKFVPRPRNHEDDNSKTKDFLILEPHSDCDYDYNRCSSGPPFHFWDHEAMRLTLLRVCRQTYSEANLVLYSTNTFAFNDAFPLHRFMMTRTAHQKRLIQHLRFAMSRGRDDYANWNKALHMPLMRSLTGLRHLRLCVIWDWDVDDHRHTRHLGLLKYMNMIDGLKKVATLPLVSAEVACRLTRYVPAKWEGLFWTADDRRACAEQIKAMLLNPKGAEEYAKEQQRFKERVAQRKALQKRTA